MPMPILVLICSSDHLVYKDVIQSISHFKSVKLSVAVATI